MREESSIHFQMYRSVYDLMYFEECQEFFLKRELPVGGFLTGNVSTHRFHLGFANRECTVSVTPPGFGAVVTIVSHGWAAASERLRLTLPPPPPSVGDASTILFPAGDEDGEGRMQKSTEEEMFKAIIKGEHSMPAFELKLSETDRWHAINFVRNLAGNEPAR